MCEFRDSGLEPRHTFVPIEKCLEVRNSMKYIGGYFELELPRGGKGFHPRATALSTGRACLSAILEHKKPRGVHLPFYVCEAVLMPMREAGIPVTFYRLDNNLVPIDLPAPDRRELLLAVNYFGLQSTLIRHLGKRYGGSYVADHTQAFFEQPDPGYWAFCSARKFFGVPDGAYLYAPEALELRPLPNFKSDIRHLVNCLIGRQQTGYHQFRRGEQNVDCRIRAMSPLSERLLADIDYKETSRRRRANYQALHALLRRDNLFDASLPAGATPFAYPFLLSRPVDRAIIARERLYVPTLWPEVVQRKSPGFSFERKLVSRLLPLPIDHRYEPAHMAEAARRLRKALALI
jgi:hypothetical protein